MTTAAYEAERGLISSQFWSLNVQMIPLSAGSPHGTDSNGGSERGGKKQTHLEPGAERRLDRVKLRFTRSREEAGRGQTQVSLTTFLLLQGGNSKDLPQGLTVLFVQYFPVAPT